MLHIAALAMLQAPAQATLERYARQLDKLLMYKVSGKAGEGGAMIYKQWVKNEARVLKRLV
eukprot:10216455-Lingulodinium_polyedra.AAC.1